MIDFSKYLHSKSGKIVMSILLGLGFATLFKMHCKGKNCYTYKIKNSEEAETNIYGFNNKCYKFYKNQMECDENAEYNADI